MSNPQDAYLLRVEQQIIGRPRLNLDGSEREYCIAGIINAEPSNADSAYAKKLLMNRLLSGSDDTIECTTTNCDVVVSKNDVANQVGECVLKDICLNDVWDFRNSNDTELSNAYQAVIGVSDGTTDANNSGFTCPNPGCDLSAGWSVDGSPGTFGSCAQSQNRK